MLLMTTRIERGSSSMEKLWGPTSFENKAQKVVCSTRDEGDRALVACVLELANA